MFSIIKNTIYDAIATHVLGRPRYTKFKYWDGRRYRWADGRVLVMRYQTQPALQAGQIEPLAQAMSQGDLDAIETLTGAIRFVFSVEDYDGDRKCGLTRLEQLQLLGQFSDWLVESEKVMRRTMLVEGA
jgi:hypothetical protein